MVYANIPFLLTLDILYCFSSYEKPYFEKKSYKSVAIIKFKQAIAWV